MSASTYNETAIYTCDDGFLIDSSREKNMTLTCAEGGNWTASVPTCVPVGKSSKKSRGHLFISHFFYVKPNKIKISLINKYMFT